jgi:hypothetical protein
MTDLESVYQEAIAAVPRSMEFDPGTSEKGWGFREQDLIKEMVNRLAEGTDEEKRSAAAALIECKTKQHGPVLMVTLPGHDLACSRSCCAAVSGFSEDAIFITHRDERLLARGFQEVPKVGRYGPQRAAAHRASAPASLQRFMGG